MSRLWGYVVLFLLVYSIVAFLDDHWRFSYDKPIDVENYDVILAVDVEKPKDEEEITEDADNETEESDGDADDVILGTYPPHLLHVQRINSAELDEPDRSHILHKGPNGDDDENEAPRPAKEDELVVFFDLYKEKCESLSRRGIFPPTRSSQVLCPCVPPTLGKHVRKADLVAQPFELLRRMYPQLKPGGHYVPFGCQARQRVLLIVPYRDRESHLRIFLRHMHYVLQKQQLEYRVFVAEQSQGGTFNKALVMNAAFLEAKKLWSFDCVIFHDVDMIMEDERNMLACEEHPRHIGAYVNKFNYKLVYWSLFGGVVNMRPSQFEQLNGYSNRFVGWGGEDDDLWRRAKTNKLRIIRYPDSISRYTMISHQRDTGNKVNTKRFKIIRTRQVGSDGLNSAKYNVLHIQNQALYTHLLISVAESTSTAT